MGGKDLMRYRVTTTISPRSCGFELKKQNISTADRLKQQTKKFVRIASGRRNGGWLTGLHVKAHGALEAVGLHDEQRATNGC